jgi:hypothetical protein
MYIWKIIIKYADGRTENEWMSSRDHSETVADISSRVNRRVDEIEHQKDVISVHMSRRTVPGI